MKIRIAVVTILLIIILITACGNKDDGPVMPEEPQAKKDIASLVPSGWNILKQAEGDLNNDGIDDAAVVIEDSAKPGEDAPSRALLIAFGSRDNTYTLSIKADNAILKANEGGVFGDPLDELSIDRGSVVIKFYGGSNWRWYKRYRFRFQDNDWYLIGATLGSYFTGDTTEEAADEEDYNLLTGDYIIKKREENGDIRTTKGNRGKRELLKLEDFVANSEEEKF